MHSRHTEGWSRREFLGLTLAGTAWLLGLRPERVDAEPPPETTTLRLIQFPPDDFCMAPQHVAEQLLRDEGFTDVQYLKKDEMPEFQMALASGEANINMLFVPDAIIRLDAGDPIVFLAGGHIGCFELFGSDQVRAVRDLKGKTVAVPDLRGGTITFVASMAAYVGLDPQRDINWVIHSEAESMQLFAEGKIDAFQASSPKLQEFRPKHIGHVVVNGTLDRPWSQYFCCMVAGNQEFVRKHPVATKRAVRAILKAADICGREPERAARLLTGKGYTTNYAHLLQALKEIPYGNWREYNPEDTVRFYALRLHEAGMIKSTPQKIIAEGTDWRFLNEIKKEMADGR